MHHSVVRPRVEPTTPTYSHLHTWWCCRRASHTGFLASTADEYAEVLAKVFSGNDGKALAEMPAKARASVQRFSDDAFMRSFSDLTMAFLTKQYFKKGQ